tara:strand:+ start:966 stop:1238 length:273 start_codon:yes stop_codon:yes gene_type:complete
MKLENHMVIDLNRDLDRMFLADTGQQRADKVEAIAESLWFDESIISEAVSESNNFPAFHRALLAGDTAEAGRIIHQGITDYINTIAEQRA